MDYRSTRARADCTDWSVEETALRQDIMGSMDGEFICVAVNLDGAPEHVDAATKTLAEDERERANRFAFRQDRERFIIARGELRRLVGESLGIPPEDVEFQYNPYGKPGLPAGFSDDNLQFNVSHSQDVAVYALTRGRRVGIDIEAVRSMPDADEVAARCFSRGELEAYRSLDKEGRRTAFFNCWTRKEAFVKAVGDGLSYPLSDFDVSLAPGEPAKILRVGELTGGECGWELNNIDGLSGFAGAVVIETSTN